MQDLILYTRTGPVACGGCEAAKAKMQAAGLDFEERAAENLSADAIADKCVASALHAYFWHTNKPEPSETPFLVDRIFRELWDADDLEYMDWEAKA